MLTTRVRLRATVALVLSAAVSLAFAQSATSQGSSVSIGGNGVCTHSTGLVAITFVISNAGALPASITSAVVTNVPNVSPVVIQPNPVEAGGSGTGVAHVPGSQAMNVLLEVSYTHGGQSGIASGAVSIPGGCVPRGTVVSSTTPEASTTSAEAATVPRPVRVTPRFTG